MAAAARLALRGRPQSTPNPSVGAIIVKHGRVIARGWTQAGGRPHAEAMALEAAGARAQGATLYVTLEPCAHCSERGPACADLIAASGLARVVVGLGDPDPRTAGEGMARIRQAGIAAEALDHTPSRASLAGYLLRRTQDRPHVTLKLATSLDGQIALADGTSRWITGEAARAHVHSRRALADAILVGGGTWRADNPRLDVRLAGLEDRSPERWVLTRGSPPEGARAIASPAGTTAIDGALYLYVEGGAQTAAAFLAADLVDRLELYRAPIVIGAGRAAISDIGLTDLAAAHGRWACVERRQLGEDMFEAYARRR
ncbi:bifunctional diaminohydroxyphosphoribosylaminopyrimidine deaminase/5-amino-6-(5-phosphoribosylamino)uracil reductase RibD [Porphyrobacter algicida]|uniref:Riboflavin biosynthesis protein RibD n=1 Tax=Qipengyuania algicida TaxID=1836209 RepID=A0A845AF46_9SPHN|nr:bifunctional diaminohydroxyphosphoribosylaminopyrimidine deaminase/5-amino-6-(5-phosphoribosylamino)uracil reductase RibD [Qipengyuania algicida]